MSFQLPSISHIIQTSIFLYREEISIFYTYLNMLQVNFRKTFAIVTQNAVYTYIIFLPRLKQVQLCTVVSILFFQTRDWRIKPHSGSPFLFEYFVNISGFFEESSWISRVIFLNFSGRLLIISRNITAKNW